MRWLAGLGAALALVAYVAGLRDFADAIPRMVEEPTRPADAIVVLTGGRQRVDTGLTLLAGGAAGRLFISGVNPEVDLSSLLSAPAAGRAADITAEDGRVTLGHDAGDTLGNATETAAWVAAHGIKSVRLVTASYHMPRSLLEFHRAMPELVILPHPVFPPGFHAGDWWRDPHSASLIIGEYTKYLGAKLRHLARAALSATAGA